MEAEKAFDDGEERKLKTFCDESFWKYFEIQQKLIEFGFMKILLVQLKSTVKFRSNGRFTERFLLTLDLEFRAMTTLIIYYCHSEVSL